MALEIWTKSSGYNLGSEPGINTSVNSGDFVVGQTYVIQTIGTTDFKKIGAKYNLVGVIFTAINNGLGAGPTELSLSQQIIETAGSGVASKIAFQNDVN